MKFLRTTAMVLMALSIMLAACGDDEAPTEPGDNPTASTLSATTGTTNNVNASWTMCPDGDFSEYNLYRSTSPDISSDPPSSPVRTSSNASDTTFTDTGLDWGETYYYALQTKNSGNNTAWSNEVQVVMPDSGGGCQYLTCYEIQGEQSSSPYVDQEVTVTGIVVSGGDELYGGYAVLSDPEGGAWRGLTVYGDSTVAMTRGDSVLVTGTVQEYFGFTELAYPGNIQIISTGHTIPSAVSLSTNDVGQEQYESVLVSVTDAVVLTENDYSYEIDDGSGSCHLGNRGDFSEPSVGDTVDALGPLFYEFDEWRIQPRDQSDITVNGGGGGGGGDTLTCYQVQGQQSASPYDGEIVTVTGIVVVGGDEYYSSSANYAVIMDAEGGAWHGLTIYGTSVASLARGDSVTITGEAQEFNDFTEISFPTDVTVHSTGHTLPAATTVTTGDAGQEKWESVLVKVSNVTVTEDDLGYGEWAVDDGTGEIRIDDLGDYSYVPSIDDTFSEIIGVCWYSFSNFKLEPRDDNDLTQR
ncbi:MAG: hypothetical protein GF388_07505 [Candidatus Aegiribacteria sp.]|nr:hypothetical protein [Candidatus Aegiribacteria sp.]MBD3294970.1 hypothetical protein [Candidatus Fermentibacteria bacterium]